MAASNFTAPVVLTVDRDRNRLRVAFRHVVRAQDMQAVAPQFDAALAALRPGFTLVTDLVDLESMDLDCVPHVTRIMDRSVAGGVAQVVRVIPDPDKDIGFGLLSLTHYRGKVPVATYDSREAERAASHR